MILENVGIGVADGKVVQLSHDTNLPPAEHVVDASGCLVLPGFIDGHTHVRDPLMTEKEDFETASQCALAGGVTTFCEMPSGNPVIDRKSFENRIREMTKRPYCDVGFYGAAATNLDGIAELAEAGVVAYKSRMESTAKNRKEFVGDDTTLLRAMRETAKTGLIHSIHLDNRAITDDMVEKMKAKNDLESFYEASPRLVEVEAAQRAILFGELTGTRVHLAHITCRETAEIVAQAKRNGKKVTAEVTTNHLHFTSGMAKRFGAFGMIHPIVRESYDRDALWNSLKAGDIDLVVSDFSPQGRKDIEPATRNISEGPAYGLGGIMQLLLPLMMTWVYEGKITLDRVLRVCCENPARLFGLFPRKGCATSVVGADADLVIVNPNRRMSISHDNFLSKSKDGLIMYDGFESKVTVEKTIFRGKVVYEEERGFIGPPMGTVIKPQFRTFLSSQNGARVNNN